MCMVQTTLFLSRKCEKSMCTQRLTLLMMGEVWGEWKEIVGPGATALYSYFYFNLYVYLYIHFNLYLDLYLWYYFKYSYISTYTSTYAFTLHLHFVIQIEDEVKGPGKEKTKHKTTHSPVYPVLSPWKSGTNPNLNAIFSIYMLTKLRSILHSWLLHISRQSLPKEHIGEAGHTKKVISK